MFRFGLLLVQLLVHLKISTWEYQDHRNGLNGNNVERRKNGIDQTKNLVR